MTDEQCQKGEQRRKEEAGNFGDAKKQGLAVLKSHNLSQ